MRIEVGLCEGLPEAQKAEPAFAVAAAGTPGTEAAIVARPGADYALVSSPRQGPLENSSYRHTVCGGTQTFW